MKAPQYLVEPGAKCVPGMILTCSRLRSMHFLSPREVALCLRKGSCHGCLDILCLLIRGRLVQEDVVDLLSVLCFRGAASRMLQHGQDGCGSDSSSA